MLDLVTFFGFVDAQEYRKATFTMQSIKVIPLEESIVEVTVSFRPVRLIGSFH